MTSIPITKPYFTEDEERGVLDSLRSGWIVQGPKVQEFETLVASFCSTRFGIATTSCTTALHLGLLALGVKPGDDVIVPSFTFIATANAVEYCGAKPIFCDIDLRTFNIDSNKIEKLITSQTKAIMPVSLFGMPLNMAGLLDIARKHHLLLLEDAACALGGVKDGKRVGSQGAKASAFSFHPRKVVTTGEGGMLVTDDEDLTNRIRSLRDHGAQRSDLERHNSRQSLLPSYNRLGYNYRMTDLQATIGVEQMRKLETLLGSRREAAARYDQLFEDCDRLLPSIPPAGVEHGYQSYVLLLSPGDRRYPSLQDLDRLSEKRSFLMETLQKEGIGVRQGTHAVHTLGYYRTRYGLRDVDIPNSLLADRLSLALPLYHGITSDEQQQVAHTLKGLVCAG